jgi:type I restriction enzyme M protein
VSRDAIKASDYSLTPGRYVGAVVSNQGDDEGEAFAARMKEIHADLADLNNTANLLAIKIQAAFTEFAE